MCEAGNLAGAGNRLPLLDGLRGIAAIGVMLYHTEVTFGPLGMFCRAYLFVDFFFLLSGFVLAMAFEPRFTAGLSTTAFLRARLRRLWPTIALGVALGAALHAQWQEPGPLLWSLLLGLLVLPDLRDTTQIFPLNGPQWSLFLEVLANLAHAVALRRLGLRGLIGFVALAGAAEAAVVYRFGSNTLGPLTFNWLYALPRVCFAYGMGVLLCRLWQRRAGRSRLAWNTLLLLPAIIVVVLAGLPMPVWIGDLLFVMVLMPALLWQMIGAPVPPVVRPALDWLGALSFPLYAVNMPIFEHCARHAPGGGLPAKLGAIVLALIAATAMAAMPRWSSAGLHRRPRAITGT